MGGRRRTASVMMVMSVLLLFLVPLAAFLALVVGQAVDVTELAGPWLSDQSARWPELLSRLERLPIVGHLMPEQGVLVAGASEAVTRVGSALINHLGAATTGTAYLAFQLFVMLYAMYFFVLDGQAILSRILYFMPLEEEEERQLIHRFTAVARATIKGSILVGLLQGTLAGAAFFVLELPAAAFFGLP